MAYMWGWTLVNVVNRAAGHAKVSAPGTLGGVIAYNRIAMLTSYIDPNQHRGVCPNQDVVYGFGYFGLDKELIAFEVLDFGDRFWVYAPFDAHTDEFSKIGKQYGTKPGFYLMVGPNWKGDLSAGINAVVRCPSTTGVFVVARILMDDTSEDHKAILPVLSPISFYPLSEFDGKMKTTDWSKLPNIPVPPSSGKGDLICCGQNCTGEILKEPRGSIAFNSPRATGSLA